MSDSEARGNNTGRESVKDSHSECDENCLVRTPTRPPPGLWRAGERKTKRGSGGKGRGTQEEEMEGRRDDDKKRKWRKRERKTRKGNGGKRRGRPEEEGHRKADRCVERFVGRIEGG